MAIGSLPPVTNEIQANSGQPGKTLAQQTAASSLLDLQAAATAEPAVAIVPETTLIEKAVAEALGRQGGLAPLYATLTQLAEAPDLPDALKATITTLLAFRLGEGNVTPERVAEAIRSSGVFHEAVAAGRMSAALSPAIRQALGGAPDEKRQAPARTAPPAPSPTTSTAQTAQTGTARPVSLTASSASPAAARPSPMVEAQPGQGGSAPLQTPAPASPVGASPSRIGGGPAPASATQGASAGTVAGAPAPTNASSPAGTAATPTSSPVPALVTAGGEALPAAPATTGAVASAPSPATAVARDGAPQPPAQQMPSADVDGIPASRPAGGGMPSPPSTPPVSSGPTGPAIGQPAAAQPSLATIVPQTAVGTPVADPDGAGAPPSQPTPAPQPPSAAATASSRAFAPWTPGRPLVPATPVTASSSPSPGTPSSSARPAPAAVAQPQGSEAPLQRPAGDKAPFVPSTVDSLPKASPGMPPRPTAGQATQPAAPNAPAQSNPGQPSASVASTQPGAEPAPTAGTAGTATSTPQVPPRASAGAPASTEPAAVSPRPVAPPAPSATPPTAMPAMPGVDLKGALEGLRRELAVWLGRNANVLANLEGGGDESVARVDRPMPPRKGGPVRGQPAVPLLGDDPAEATSTETLAGRALGEAERSLSRVFLHQAATAESRDAKVAQPTQSLMFEIPIAGPNGTSIAQLRIERDDRAPTEAGGTLRRVFQVDIAFDIAPLGPVAVRVGLMDGRRVAVGVWCESDDGLVRMEAERENIVLGLEQEGMVVAGLDLHRGHPPEGREETTTAANHRLDLQL